MKSGEENVIQVYINPFRVSFHQMDLRVDSKVKNSKSSSYLAHMELARFEVYQIVISIQSLKTIKFYRFIAVDEGVGLWHLYVVYVVSRHDLRSTGHWFGKTSWDVVGWLLWQSSYWDKAAMKHILKTLFWMKFADGFLFSMNQSESYGSWNPCNPGKQT